MRKISLAVLAFVFVLTACEEPIPHVLFDEADTVKVASKVVAKDNYEGDIPGMDAQVIDYTLPNPYQHVKQLFRDSTVATSWDEAGFPNAKAFIIFFKNFQIDVMDRKKEKIASVIKFPLRDYKDSKAFLRNYDSIFGQDFVTEVLDQDPLEIYRDKKGAMIGEDGQIWFKMINGKYRIIEINP